MNAKQQKVGNTPIPQDEADFRVSALSPLPQVIFNIATVQRRRKSFIQVLKSLSEQYIKCDVINVALSYDGYDKEIAEFIEKNFKSFNIKWGKFSCEHKLYKIDSAPDDSYVLTFDDDINYPKDYSLRLIEGIERYQRKSVVSYHGVKFKKFPVIDFYDRELYQYYEYLGEDKPLHVVGSGVMGFYAKTLKEKGFNFDILSHSTNITDDVISRFCRENKIDMNCLRHPLVWLKIMPDTQDEQSTWMVAAKDNNRKSIKYLTSSWIKKYTDKQIEIIKRYISSDALLMIMCDAVERKKPLSLSRMSDGEREIILAYKGKAPVAKFLTDEKWLTEYGLLGADLNVIGENLIKAAVEADYFCPNIYGFINEDFGVLDIVPEREVYGEGYFNYAWQHYGRMREVFNTDETIGIICRNPMAVAERLSKIYNHDKFETLDYSSWRDYDNVLERIGEMKSHLIFCSGGASMKYLVVEGARKHNKVMVDVGGAMINFWK